MAPCITITSGENWYNPLLLPHFHAYVMRMRYSRNNRPVLFSASRLTVKMLHYCRLQWTGHKLLFAHKYLFLIIKCVNYSLDKLKKRTLWGELCLGLFVLQKAASLEKVNFQKCPCCSLICKHS